MSSKSKNDKILTWLIVIVSISGILFFGLRAVLDPLKQTDNPHEFDMDAYEVSVDSSKWIELKSIPLNLNRPKAISVDSQNRIYVAGDSLISRYNVNGEIESEISTSEFIHCLAVDLEYNLYIGMTDHIEIWNMDGNVISVWESLGEHAFITSVAVSDSYIYVADAGQLTVWQYTLSGSLVRPIGRKNESKGISGFVIPSPYFDVAIGPDKSLWVANTGRHSLENYDSDGNLRTAWGDYSTRVQDFCGCCNPSHFAIAPDGSFVTAEKGIVRLKSYSSQGKLNGMIAGPELFQAKTVGLDLTMGSDGKVYVLDPKQKVVRIFINIDGEI